MIHQVIILILAASIQSASPVPFENNGLWGYKDANGQVVIEARYKIAGEYSSEGIAAVVDDEGWAYIDCAGSVVIRPHVYDNGPDYFSEGLARYKDNNKFGFFDRQGWIVIKAAYDFAVPFREGRAAVCNGCRPVQSGEHSFMEGGSWGYIDNKGNVVIPLQYDAASSFYNGTATVMLDGKEITIDKQGHVTGRQ
ncbi:MAG: WG repeat-containing protein [Nitrospirota bacterium]|nr:MAG: WG repeat-containing protein [Nitrospirota bacterium]